MADLIGRKRAEPSKIIGADPITGSEENYAGVTENNDLMVSDTPNTSGLFKTISVTTTPIELKVGASALLDRKLAHIQSQANGLYFGYDNTVSASNGTLLFKSQILFVPVGGGVSLWLVSTTGGGIDVRIGELS